MHKIIGYMVLIALVSAIAFLGNFIPNVSAQAQKDKSKNPNYTTTTDLKRIRTPFGPEASPVFGDFSKWPHITYMKRETK